MKIKKEPTAKFAGTGAVELVFGDALETLKTLGDAGRVFDALVTDPPYCSGGLTPAERRRTSNDKYRLAAKAPRPSFDDGLDQVALWDFSRAWLTAARKILAPIGYVAIFCDWRNLPVFASALQASGMFWRGVGVWDKGNARPNRGHFTQTCEFVLWGTSTDRKSEKYGWGYFPAASVSSANRTHPTEKPTDVLKSILAILPDSARAVVDPFAGSGTTGVAAREMGLDFVGVENNEHYFNAMKKRLALDEAEGASIITNVESAFLRSLTS